LPRLKTDIQNLPKGRFKLVPRRRDQDSPEPHDENGTARKKLPWDIGLPSLAELARTASREPPVRVPPAPVLKRHDWLLMLMFALLAFASVTMSMRGIGLSWDEAYYYRPSVDAAQWLGRMLYSADKPISNDAITAYWSDIPELPSLVKFAMGISRALLRGILGELGSLRIPSALALSGSLVLIYLLMFPAYGRAAAVASCLAYGLMPRVFGHAHFAASESLTVFMMLGVVYCFLQGLRSWRWSVVLGIVFGLALATKINCFFLPLILIPWAHVYHRTRYVNNFFAMVFLGPLVMILCWPWLWHEPVQRLLDYFQFHSAHQYTALYYFGTKYNYGSILAPWHYPLVITIVTTPVVTLLLIVLGVAWILVRLRSKAFGTLVLLGAGVQLLIASLPATPKYDGVRLFLPAFPFLAMVAGVAVAGLMGIVAPERRIWRNVRARDAIAVVLLVLLAGNGLWGIMRSHPRELSYFNLLIGGLPGAFARGMETTYWGEAINGDVVSYLNRTMPPDAKVKVLAAHGKVFELLQQWGELRGDLVFDADPPYDYHLLLVRKGFFARPEWCLFKEWMPLQVFSFRGVPFVAIYKTGIEFEHDWPRFQM
jgi:4-amino-4-deoxy-L-arabinose transferase-like glycosyltransferase